MGKIPDQDTVPVGPCKVRAIYSWSGEDKRDLGFIEGDVIEVLNTGDGNWWTGRLKRNRVVGLFPRNFVEFVDADQQVMSIGATTAPLSIADLGISDPLANSQASERSTKSAEEILKDVEAELNRGYLDDVTLDIDPDALLSSIGSKKMSYSQSSNALALSQQQQQQQKFPQQAPQAPMAFTPAEVISEAEDETDDAPLRSSVDAPVPPPHKVSTSISKLDEVLSPIPASESPNLEDVPFDTKAFQPASSSAKTGPAISAAPKPITKKQPPVSQTVTRTTRPAKQSMLSVTTAASNSPENAGRKFLKKLLPKNTQQLHRRTPSSGSAVSTGGKSFMSIRSSASRKLRGFKSIFSFTQPDSDLYPTNELHSTTTHKSTLNVPRNRGSNFSEGGSVGGRPSVTANDGINPERRGMSGGKWIAHRRDLYRAKTLNHHEREKRTQAMELQGVSSNNPVAEFELDGSREFHDYRLEDHSAVDDAILSMSTWPQLMTPAVLASSRIGRHFSDNVSQLRAVFLLCTSHIDYDAAGSPGGGNVINTRKANARELSECIVAMCGALNIDAHVVDGHIRTDLDTMRPHSWVSVDVEGERRFLDVAAASPLFTGEEDVSQFYFLVPPHELIYTHVPSNPAHQYLGDRVLATSVVASLPVACPAAFAHNITFSDFSVGMTRLSGLEVCELAVAVPNESTDIVATIEGSEHSALAQPFRRSDGSRHFRIKAFVPDGQSQATLRLYAVDRTELRRTPMDMELVWTLPLRQTEANANAPYEFLARYAAPQPIKSDLYIQEPQCREIAGGENYTFQVEFFPHSSEARQPKLAVQSPSGRVTRLVPRGTDAHDVAKVTVKTLEVGPWRAVVSSDDSEVWMPFGEWFCS